MAILLVEQLVEKALRHANYGYLVETGRIAAEARRLKSCARATCCTASIWAATPLPSGRSHA